MPVIIDPRRHDAVVFDSTATATDPSALATLLEASGVGTAALASLAGGGFDVHAAGGAEDAARRLRVRPDRAVVIAGTEDGVTAARRAGFALVIGFGDDKDGLRRGGADAVVADLAEITVRGGDRRMSALPDAMTALDLGQLLADRSAAVFFDFDGTLSDIVDDPDAAALTPGADAALRALARVCPVAILSGRDLADVTDRVGVPGLWYAGSHGFELTAPDGSRHRNDTAAQAIPVLQRVADALRERLADVAGAAVEHKTFAVAVHYRNAARDRVAEVTSAVRAAGRDSGLRVTTGREVIELRPDIDWDKGRTLRWVTDRMTAGGAAERLLPIFLGDDITDEDAFDAVDADGVGIIVRHSDDGDRATAARFALDSPQQARAFTERLAEAITAAGSSGRS
ncbi:trehalose-phosphatase [Mycolicibacillus trivialis]|uniref:Trehalose 6-phosphate phosphatase n=1 Tax=Mycolicibacillus trivialis TaxID=1798 RepID=A0A1X2EE68_9MYCO|nr:trehalose-phosphatase [Mycolicibacillus trivialis]ORW99197.1 trehalose phosphatase [Mycolicibacillus trivialis]